MTKYHRTMLIEKAIEHWNREKYREQGNLLLLYFHIIGSQAARTSDTHNVKHANNSREESQAALAGLLRRLRLSDENIKEAHEAHCRFIRNFLSTQPTS